jgi:hypothetical protein
VQGCGTLLESRLVEWMAMSKAVKTQAWLRGIQVMAFMDRTVLVELEKPQTQMEILELMPPQQARRLNSNIMTAFTSWLNNEELKGDKPARLGNSSKTTIATRSGRTTSLQF